MPITESLMIPSVKILSDVQIKLTPKAHSLWSPQNEGSSTCWFSRESGLYPVVRLNTKYLILLFLLLHFSLFCRSPPHMKRKPLLTYMSRFLISQFTSLHPFSLRRQNSHEQRLHLPKSRYSFNLSSTECYLTFWYEIWPK